VTTTLVDSNVILDVVTDDQEWGDWSAAMLSEAARQGRLVINPIIYAEVACRFTRIEELDASLPSDYFTREPLPWAAGFLAARAFIAYRRRGGSRPTPLPDFFIGAHAAIQGYTLLTRDRRRYKTYFPKLRVIEP
jgi:predicted nucleic acid-binding protein